MSKVIGVTVGTSISPNSMKSKLDLSQYAKSEWVEENFQQKGNYLAEEQLPEAINTALAQAKASGEFDGKNGVDGKDGQDGSPGKDGKDGKDGANGKTPVKGTDYWTNADKQEIVSDVLDQIDIPEGSASAPVFDLAAMGMVAVTLPTGVSSVDTDTAELQSALGKGNVIFVIPVNMGGATIPVAATMQGIALGDSYQCMSLFLLNDASALVVNVDPGAITVMVFPASTAIGFPAVTAADNGKIMEIVNGKWEKVALKDSSVATFVDEYISSALEGDY